MPLNVQVLIAMTVIICLSMAGLGYLLNTYVRHSAINSATRAEAFHVSATLEPLLRDVQKNVPLPDETLSELDKAFAASIESGHADQVVVWWPTGTIAYSTNKARIGHTVRSPELESALGGEVVAHLEHLSEHGEHMSATTGNAYLEIYMPLRHTETGEIFAVGEIYQRAEEVLTWLRSAAIAVWSFILLTTLVMLGLLYLTVARASAIVAANRLRLNREIAEQARLARQNDRLRKVAENARFDAFKINEDLLNQIGADLHDGPLQLLSLIMLRLKGASSVPPRPAPTQDEGRQMTLELASGTIQELRNLAQGLVLPELEELTVADALSLAVSRHENLTNTTVKSDLHDLPEQLSTPVKICLYRAVQESLNNAFRHGGGIGQQVTASANGQRIEITVSDRGPGIDEDASSSKPSGIGLQGLARRIQTFDGSLTVSRNPGGGTVVTVSLPVKSSS